MREDVYCFVLSCLVWFVVFAVAAAVAVAAVAAVAAAFVFFVVVAVALVWSGLAGDSLEGFGLGILMGQWVIVCLRPPVQSTFTVVSLRAT